MAVNISVIIPHLPERELKTNLNSQTYKDFEVIVIEDKDRKGANWARNKGVKKAKGKYLMFLDDDLDLEPTLLEELYNALKDTEHSLAYCGFHQRGKINGTHKSSKWNYEQLKENNYISTCSLVRAEDFPGFDEKLKRLQDWDLWLTMGESGKTGIWVNKILFTANYAEDAISISPDYNKHLRIVKDKHNL